MRKFGIFSATIFISILIAGLYGILHDQLTYTISSEYFTKFKYHQFGLEPDLFGGHRQTVIVIGFMSTWWVGLCIGTVLGLISLSFTNHIIMKSAIAGSLKIVFVTAVIFALIGYLRGQFYLNTTNINWWIPDDVINRKDFIIVGSIHNYSYIGSAVGLALAVIFMIRKIIPIKKESAKEY